MNSAPGAELVVFWFELFFSYRLYGYLNKPKKQKAGLLFSTEIQGLGGPINAVSTGPA